MAEAGSGWERVRDARGRSRRPGVAGGRDDAPAAPARRRARADRSRTSARRRRPRTRGSREHLEDAHGAQVVHVSGNLADRAALRERARRRLDADVFLVELKAAAIDVVAEAALARGAEVVLAANDVVPLRRRAGP